MVKVKYICAKKDLDLYQYAISKCVFKFPSHLCVLNTNKNGNFCCHHYSVLYSTNNFHSCRNTLDVQSTTILQLGSILFDKALTAAFLQKYPTWQRFALWHNGEICQAKSTHNLSGSRNRRRVPKNEENNSIEWRKCALVNRVIGQLFWDLGLKCKVSI